VAYVITKPWLGVKNASWVEVCPVDSILPEDPVSVGWKRFIQINADHLQKVRR